MKTTKLILMLIILAMLSFSCKEDESKDDDDIVISTNPIDYIPKENSIYTYTLTYTTDEPFELDKNIKHKSYVSYKGFNALEYETEYYGLYLEKEVITDYYRIEGSKLYASTNELVKFLSIVFKLQEEDLKKYINDWYLLCDFEKESWTVLDFNMPITEFYEKEGFTNILITGYKLKNEKLTIEGKKYYGIVCNFKTFFEDIYFEDGLEFGYNIELSSELILLDGIGKGKVIEDPGPYNFLSLSYISVLKKIN